MAKVPAGELVAYERDAVAAQNIALSELVRIEFKSRSNRGSLDAEFDREFAKLKVPTPAEAPLLRKIAGTAITAEQRLKEFLSGRPDPMGRLTAARKAGLVEPVKLATDQRARFEESPEGNPAAPLTAHRQASGA